MTPFATLTEPVSMAPTVGSAICQRIFPVVISRALHDPHVIYWPDIRVYGRWWLSAIAT